MTAPIPLHRLPVRLLSDLMSPRALERVIQDAAQARGLPVAGLDRPALEDILKREVFKRLQLSVPAPLAKKRVSEVLAELLLADQAGAAARSAPAGGPDAAEAARAEAARVVSQLEEGLRRFALYFDWPETQRLRGVLGIARQQQQDGQAPAPLLQEGQDLLGALERRLQEELVIQAQDLAELRATFARVQGLGSRDVRRVEGLINQIAEAQDQQVLLPAEVDRARTLAFKLRRSLESSVVQPGGGAAALPADAQARVQALEQEHVARRLSDLGNEYALLFELRPDLAQNHEKLRETHAAGTLRSESAEAWQVTLAEARRGALEQQRNELAELDGRFENVQDSPAAQDARLRLEVARSILAGDGLITAELRELSTTLTALNSSPETMDHLLEQQRELAELERAARDVPGAQAELSADLAAARSALVLGQVPDLGPLWRVLERHMGRAAQQREDFDARADHVVEQYDRVRTLAGETTQSLGRLAETLRAQRRLGPMSPQARTRYAQTLEGAEALLIEARAEYEAAQQVTSTFGEDALSGLLGLFDLGGDADAPELAPATGSSEDAPARRDQADSGLPHGAWTVTAGEITDGPAEEGAAKVASLLAQAAAAGLHRLDMGDASHVWSARLGQSGDWRLARAADWDTLDREAGAWLDG
ncbi:hypothetical protein [Deinococcus sp. Leaf326]|uniref:hypothetical protein n=1 Tax=Deinococcus sp. Leaf326 TaxID=1736338 RepID=UPI000B0E9E44